MKTITLFITSLCATASLALAEGIPVDHDTGKVTVPHTIVSLTPEQIEETQTLGTFTLTPEQWRKIRAKSPQCPKRFHTVLPVTWNDCACGVEEEYVIALSRDRIAVLDYGDSSASVESIRRELFKDHRVTSLRMNERGEFFAGGKLVPFPTLLKALATPPDDAKHNDAGSLVVTATEDGREFAESRWLVVELPVGAKPTDAVFESRLRQIASAADQMGLSHVLFP